MYIGVCIALYPTDSGSPSPRQAQPAEAEASLRADLAERLTAAQGEIEASLARLRQDARGLALAEMQLQGLATLQQRVAFADPRQLLALRNEVVAVAAAVQMMASQARPAADPLDGETPVQKARRALDGLVDDYYEKKILDPYLRFASAEDEAAFRKREAERKAAIDAARSEDTPEGNARAARLMQAQLRDAGARGADQSPDFEAMSGRSAATTKALDAQADAEKQKEALATDPMAALRAAGVAVADGGAPTTAPGSAGKSRSLG